MTDKAQQLLTSLNAMNQGEGLTHPYDKEIIYRLILECPDDIGDIIKQNSIRNSDAFVFYQDLVEFEQYKKSHNNE